MIITPDPNVVEDDWECTCPICTSQDEGKTEEKMKRPRLNQIPLAVALQWLADAKPGFVITMSIGQWDKFLEEGYFRQDAILIELDSSENPIAAYRNEEKVENG